MSQIIDEIEIYSQDESGLITSGKAQDTTIPTTTGRFAPGCTLLGTDGETYRNEGTTASPSWVNAENVSSSEIASGAVTLAKLATGISPSHIVKFAGNHTTAGGGISEDKTITGVLSTDIVIATVKTLGVVNVFLLSATTATDKITFTFTADPSTDHVISYQVLRAIA